jgi:hypothetical protein
MRASAAPTQDEIDRVVVDKVRARRFGAITLFEMHAASPGLIPRAAIQQAFQDSFDKLWVDEVASLEWEGADLTFALGTTPSGDVQQPTLVLNMETPGINPLYVHDPKHMQAPSIRIWVNDAAAGTSPIGGWDV